MIIFAVFVLHIIIRFLIHTHTPTNNYINFSQSTSQISDHHEYHLQPGNEFRIAYILSAIFIIPGQQVEMLRLALVVPVVSVLPQSEHGLISR